MPSAVNGYSVAYTAAGGILLWSGIKGATISDTVRSVLAGSTSPPVTETLPGTAEAAAGASAAAGATAAPGNTGAASATAAQNQATAKLLAVSLGHPTWVTGQEWADWASLWNQESGWLTTALNSSSGATGIPQLNPAAHTIPAGWNGPTAAVVQITWGIDYIASTYGSPSAAWAFDKAHGLQGY